MSGQKPSHLGGGGAFEVFCEASASAEPCESALDDPAPGQELEPFDPGRSLDDLDGPRAGECIDELFAAIDPIGKDVPQSGEAVVQALQQRNGAVDILNVGGMNVYCQQQAVGVGDDVALAPVQALAGVKAARTAGLRGRGRLAVDDASRRLRLAAELAPRPPNQGFDDPLPPAAVAPGVKITLHRRVWRKLLRQGPPLAAGGQNVEDRLHDLAQIDFPRSSPASARRHAPDNQCPFRIGQIACVAKPITLILNPSDFGPRHRALPRIFANPKELQPDRNHSHFFGQALRSALLRASRRMGRVTRCLKERGSTSCDVPMEAITSEQPERHWRSGSLSTARERLPATQSLADQSNSY